MTEDVLSPLRPLEGPPSPRGGRGTVEFGTGRILVVVYGHVADTMAAVPGLRSLRRAHPQARIEVLALRSVAPILDGCPYVDEVLTWTDFQRKSGRAAKVEKAARLAALGLRLRPRGYAAVIIFHRSFKALRRLATLSGAPIRAGVTDGSDGYTHNAPPVEIGSSRDENRRVLAALGVEEDGGPLELWTSDADRLWVDDLVRDEGNSGPLVGLHPGSDWSCQQWLPERFGQVGRLLQEEAGARIVVTGSAAERRLQQEIAEGLEAAPIRAAGATSLGRLVALIRRLDLLVCVNSAPAAIARAVGTPAVVLLGPEDARLTGLTVSDTLSIVQPGRRLEPGSWCEFGRWGMLSGCESPMCRGLSGLDQLAPEEVVTEALNLLRHRRPALAGRAV